jgi:SAM-dependent methyltransferase
MTSQWADRALQLYNADYAKRYRAHDDGLDDSVPYLDLVSWLQSVCGRFAGTIDALDFGCGTGRYFWSLHGVRRLVGLDASPSMLEEARHPVHGDKVTAEHVTLMQADLTTHQFPPENFDLVYSVGVLAEHVPLDESLVGRIHRWLRPDGRFAFTTVHPESPSIPRTIRRRLGRAVSRLPPLAGHRGLRDRLLSGGLYADERRIDDLLAGGFAIERLERFDSEAHLHCRCVARRLRAESDRA